LQDPADLHLGDADVIADALRRHPAQLRILLRGVATSAQKG
jgi:hypothetical protein